MGRWKRFGVIVVLHGTDHDPMHVHVFEDGKRVLKFKYRIVDSRSRKAELQGTKGAPVFTE